MLVEASAAPGPPRSALSDTDLLEGAVLGWEMAAAPQLITPEEAVALDDEMRAFVAPYRAIGDPAMKLRRLLEGMRDRGLFAMSYSDSFTRSASRTFHERQGNCLSFTMLFVALARAAGLDARYQMVDVPPTWTNDNELVVIANHVNTAVNQSYARGATARSGEPFPRAQFDRKIVVDFNAANFRANYQSRVVADRYVVALFYNNLAAEALVRKQYAEGFELLREAARTYSDMPAPWVNLGVLYSRVGQYAYAEAAYRRALEADPREQAALSNLVAVYNSLGDDTLAEAYRQRIRRYREINPYYHYAVAQIAFDERRFEDALAALRSAIRLKRDDDDFYDLRGRTLVELGRDDRAVASFARAKELASEDH
jgi:tetratricopeptide (TPR) repeat protein